MKRIWLLLLLCGGMARGALTTVAETLVNADGTNPTGSCVISWPYFTSATGAAVAANRKTITVTAGAVSVTLEPNDHTSTVYTVVCTWSTGSKVTEYWRVGTSTPTTVGAVRLAVPPQPSITVTKGQLPAATAYEDEANIFTAAGGVTLANQMELRLREATGGGTNYIGIRAPAALASNFTITLAAIAAGYFKIDGTGAVSWAFPPFSEVTGTIADSQVPNLNTLSTGLTVSRCVETDGSGFLTVAAGPCGVGTGDFSSNTATSVDSEIVLFSGTAGKTGKRATQTGLLTGTSGVIGSVTAPTGAVVGAGQGNTFTTGVQDFSGATALVVVRGTAAPSSGACDAAAEVGSLYVQAGDPASVNPQVFRCAQTGASSYAWHPISHYAATACPATCSVGNLCFDTDATVGQNLFGCTSANTWTLLGDSSGATGYQTVKDEGSDLTQRNTIDFAGAGVTCVDSGGTKTLCTIPSTGGNSTTTGTYGSNPGTCTDGDVRFPSDSFYVLRCVSNAWIPWGPIFPMTQPVDGDFAWINQGSATVSATKGGIYLEDPGSASINMRIRKKAAPSPPYTITAAFLPSLTPNTTASPGVGIGWRQSSDGKLVVVAWGHNASSIFNVNVQKWTSATAYSADYDPPSTTNRPLLSRLVTGGPLMIFCIADDNTNRIVSYSNDGQNFKTIASVGRTDFMTADEVGFFVDVGGNSGTDDNGMTLLSWKQGTTCGQ